MMSEPADQWNGNIVRKWLESRVAAARADQAAAERSGRSAQDECDKASAEELVCTALQGKDATNVQSALADELKNLLARDEYAWRGVYDDARFDRHVRFTIRKILKMTKANIGFDNIKRYQ